MATKKRQAIHEGSMDGVLSTRGLSHVYFRAGRSTHRSLYALLIDWVVSFLAQTLIQQLIACHSLPGIAVNDRLRPGQLRLALQG